jgi:hypothetical protein
VAASFLELGWTDTIERAALHWRHRVLRGRQTGDQLPPGTYHELRYEDLVTHTESSLRALCDAVDLPFDPAMLDHRRAAAAVARTEPRPHHNRYLGRAVMPRLRDWRRDLPAAAVARFEEVAGDVLAELGYELRTTKRTLGTRLAARSHWLAWHSQRLTPRGRRRQGPGATRG